MRMRRADGTRAARSSGGMPGQISVEKEHALKVVLPSKKSESCWFMLNSMLGSMGTHNPPVDVEDLMSIICMFVT